MTEPRHAAEATDELVRALVAGELRFHQLPTDLDPAVASIVRRRALEEMTKTSLKHTGHYSLDAKRASTRHCENFLGAAQIPIGVAGPLLVRGEHIDEQVYLPLATTEGALIASINRGCAALCAAGGAQVYVEEIGISRAPVFRSSGIEATRRFLSWVDDHEEEIRELAEKTSSFLRMVEVRPFAFGSTIFLRFRFESSDAMGMNMATIACDRVVRELLEPATGIKCIALSGNYCADKKPSSINFHEGRGKRIHAEAVLTRSVLKQLRSNADSLAEVQYRKNLLGSIAAGSSGFNAHYANVLAAFFVATGQDLAHVVEGSIGVTCIEPRADGAVFASVFLPGAPLAAIGGGTSLETQREALDLLGVVPAPDCPGAAVMRLAEILGAAVLAGELSLLAAFTSGDLARAHERLGRSRGS